MKAVFIILFILLCLVAACSSGYFVNMEQKTKFPEGRELFVSKCGGCHQLYNPVQYSTAEWDSLLFIMQKKAKIGVEQKVEIYKWIIEIKENSGDNSKSGSQPVN